MGFARFISTKRFLALSISFFGFILSTQIAFAANITYSSDTTVSFGSLNLTIEAGSTASSVTINSSTMSVVTGVGDTFTLKSADRYTISSAPQQTETCTSSLFQVVVAASQTVTLTPTTTACVVTGGSSAPRPTSTPTPTLTETSTDTATTTPTTEIEYFSDIGELTTKQKKNIVDVTNFMIQHKTLFPITSTKKYYPNNILTYGYAIQIANSFTALGCGSNDYLGIHSCSDHAIKMGYLDKGHAVNSRIKRIDFYRLLLNAMNKKVFKHKNALAQIAKYCSDSSDISLADADLYLTARRYAVVTRFKSGKCQLKLNLSRVEAAAVGAQVMSR